MTVNRFQYIKKIVNLILSVASGLSFLTGYLQKNQTFDWVGLIFLNAVYIIILVETGVLGVNYRKTSEMKKTDDYGLTMLILGIIVVIGFISLVIKARNEIYSLIWISTVIQYALSGVVYSLSTGIPVKMTYGGWKTIGNRKPKQDKN
ncbi:hypothetical protein [Sphingobacterium mizutaii]|uniref:hypothetical protein n=1 Tax=Sphingobacterium mizutaii TaxID=1010 RepID=UPI001627ADBE|nr:hypothetical protein [Sphingobacterium mizutaii]